MSDQITCSLIENSLDYLLLAGEQAQEGSERMLKHAVATLGDGVELLLKARLEATDWKLVFADEARASLTDYQNGNFKSVTVDDAIKRLRDKCGVALRSKHKKVLHSLRNLRNKVRHFALTADRTSVTTLIAKTYSFALDFIGEHLDSGKSSLPDELARLRGLLGEFEDFVNHRMAEIQPELNSNRFAVYVDCPACTQPALHADGGTAICLFCSRRTDGEHAAYEWAVSQFGWQSPKDELISPSTEACPECGSDACVNVGLATDSDVGYLCFSCGEHGEYDHCSGCGMLTSDDYPGSYCGDCWGDMLDRND